MSDSRPTDNLDPSSNTAAAGDASLNPNGEQANTAATAQHSGYHVAAEIPPGEGTEAGLDYAAREREYVRVELAEGAKIDDRGPTALTATVRRGVNMRNWIILGLAVGVVAAVVLTYAFPEISEFSRGQVLGFLLVFVTALGGVLFAGIAALVDLIVSRRTRTITLTREN